MGWIVFPKIDMWNVCLLNSASQKIQVSWAGLRETISLAKEGNHWVEPENEAEETILWRIK